MLTFGAVVWWCGAAWCRCRLALALAVDDERRLFRTHYFPGLGWLMRRELWLELRDKWPLDHWDHWCAAAPPIRPRTGARAQDAYVILVQGTRVHRTGG
jgi:hypothetical protein